ncbi:MAG: methyltransferase domain-containing protein [Candidatus Methanomethylophilaceae archaeon]|nr:methyltransferase domain-containing protein [Candidatus Methanomethylophilaceae archaeon]
MQEICQFMRPHGEEGKKVIEEMIESHKDQIEWGVQQFPEIHPERILDIGCGGGNFSRLLLEKYPGSKVYGLDISETSLEYCREYNGKYVGEGRLELTLGDVIDMPYDDGFFDLIVSNSSYFFWPDLRGSMKEIARVLREDGLVCITTGCHFENHSDAEGEEFCDGFRVVTGSEMMSCYEGAGLRYRACVGPGGRKCAYFGRKGTDDEEGIRQHMLPRGEEGEAVLKSMNDDHRPQIQWGIDHLPEIRPSKILDVGCGGGVFIRLVLERYPEAKGFGIDLSELSVEHARAFNADLGDRAEFEIANVERLPFGDGEFDLVVSNASHFFWPNLAEDIKEVGRVIRTGGTLCFTAGIHYETKPAEEEMKGEGVRNYAIDSEMIGMLDAAGIDAECFADPESGRYVAYVGIKRRRYRSLIINECLYSRLFLYQQVKDTRVEADVFRFPLASTFRP